MDFFSQKGSIDASVFFLCNKNGGPSRYKGGFYMASYTQHYQLHQWEPGDDFLRTDFNEDFKKIDTAIKTTEEKLRTDFNGEISRLDAALNETEEDLRSDFNGNLDSVNTALSQLEKELRAEHTADISRLDTLVTSLKNRVEIVIGTYTGNGEMDQQITLGFRPKAVLIEHQDGRRSGGNGAYFWAGLVPGQGQPVAYLATVNDQGFIAHQYARTAQTNADKEIYYYLALR